jgi:preprotein translocase subunit SecG
MTTLFIALIILASVLLGAIVLIQNPKGGGLAGNIAGFSNQFMGVKQTTDVLEKGTWILASALVVLCLVSALVIKTGKGASTDTIKNIPTTGSTTNQSTPAIPAQPLNPAPAK